MHLSRRSLLAAGFAVAGACSKSKRTLTVGAKNVTEIQILGEIIAMHLERRLNQKIDRRLSLPGTQLAHDAMVAGTVDIQAEYTTAAHYIILKEEPNRNSAIAFERLRLEYRRNFLAEWLDPLGLDSCFILAANKKIAEERKLSNITDIVSSPIKLRLASAIEFQERPDGLPALSSYRIQWYSAPRVLENDRLYRLLNDGLLDVIAVNATDGRLEKVPHVVLTDDKRVFRPQSASIVVRQDALKNEPNLQKFLNELSGKFNNNQMRDWNYKVDVLRRSPADVAQEFIRINP